MTPPDLRPPACPPARPPACLPVGAVVEEPPLHVVHIAVEMAPICKVGRRGWGSGWALAEQAGQPDGSLLHADGHAAGRLMATRQCSQHTASRTRLRPGLRPGRRWAAWATW